MTHRSALTKDLGLLELVAIALGGMIGGGIFSILGIAVEQLGNAVPLAIMVGTLLALLAAWSYACLARYYEDEGATYSFFKRTYPDAPTTAAAIGWLVVFGYVTTLALYAFTFASYLVSLFPGVHSGVLHMLFSGGVLLLFAVLNIVSVRQMGRVEDLMVYTKLFALILVTLVLYGNGSSANARPIWEPDLQYGSVFVVAALTFVAFEGFQLAIHAYSEVRDATRNVPRAIYISVAIAGGIYILMAEGALWALDKQQIIEDKEFALAAGATAVLGPFGYALVLGAALLATSSAISGTLFGASRLMAILADDGCFPQILGRRIHQHTPAHSIAVLAILAWILVLSGGLQLILEFASLTFIVVSFVMALANLKMREHTGAKLWLAILSVLALAAAGVLILLWQLRSEPAHLAITLAIGVGIAVSSKAYGRYASPR